MDEKGVRLASGKGLFVEVHAQQSDGRTVQGPPCRRLEFQTSEQKTSGSC